MKLKNFFNIITLFWLTALPLHSSSENQLTDHINDHTFGDLKDILKERYIRILTTKNSFDYYIYQGTHKGFQYEMVKAFIDFLNKKYSKGKNVPKIQFELIPTDYNQLIPALLTGKGHIIAAGLSIEKNRKHTMYYSTSFRTVNEIVIGNNPNSQKENLYRKQFLVNKNSPYFQSLKKYNHNHVFNKRIRILPLNNRLNSENIIELISLKKYDYTLVDEHIANMATTVFDGIYIVPQNFFKKDISISWAVRKESLQLLKEINQFIPKFKKGTLYGNLMSKEYFEDVNRIGIRIIGGNNQLLSPYDDLIKKYASIYKIDWRLLAALCFQESRFKQNIKNKWGAIGLFQIKKMTANEPYINISNIEGESNAENNIRAGIKYFAWIKNRYFDSVPDMSEKNKLRMTMAAYNAGPRSVINARKKAKALGLNSNKWFRNVELAMLKLNKIEPVNYVSEINKRYVSFRLLGIK